MSSFKSRILGLNKQGMKYLKNCELKASQKHLLEAEKELKHSKVATNSKLWGVTLNNIGCYYMKSGKPLMALHYYERALLSEIQDATDSINRAGTYMNISKIHSTQGDFKSSIRSSKKALELLRPLVSEKSVVNKITITCNLLAKDYYKLNDKQAALEWAKDGLLITKDKNLIKSLKNTLKMMNSNKRKEKTSYSLTTNKKPTFVKRKNCSISTSRAVQVRRLPDLKDKAAMVIQGKWREFKGSLNDKEEGLDRRIEIAEKNADAALKELDKLKLEKERMTATAFPIPRFYSFY